MTPDMYERIESKLSKIEKAVCDDEYESLKKKERELESIKWMLSKIRLKVKGIRRTQDASTGRERISVSYEKEILLEYDEEGLIRNDEFYSINMLNLIDINDMGKIQDAIGEVLQEREK